jgi:hypothetical protein
MVLSCPKMSALGSRFVTTCHERTDWMFPMRVLFSMSLLLALLSCGDSSHVDRETVFGCCAEGEGEGEGDGDD